MIIIVALRVQYQKRWRYKIDLSIRSFFYGLLQARGQKKEYTRYPLGFTTRDRGKDKPSAVIVQFGMA